jgi:hypothetical protein
VRDELVDAKVASAQPERPADCRSRPRRPRHRQGHPCRRAYRFHWSVIPPEEPLPIAAGRTGRLARARSIAEQALRASAADFRMQTEVTCLDPSDPRYAPNILTGGWWLVTALYPAGHCHRRIRRQWADPARVHWILEGAGSSEVSLTPLDPVIQLTGPNGQAEAADFVMVMGPLMRVLPSLSAAKRENVRATLEVYFRGHAIS